MEDPSSDQPDGTEKPIDEERQVWDIRIKEGVTSLRDKIGSWIKGLEEHMGKNSQDLKGSFKRVLKRDPDLCLRNLGYHDNTSRPADIKWLQWMCERDSCIHFILGRHIWTYLYKKIFSTSYPVGMSDNLAKLIEVFSSSKRRGGDDEGMKIRVDNWKLDTIRLSTERISFEKVERNSGKDISQKLIKSLSVWFDKETLSSQREALRQNIVKPAITLHRQIICAPYNYWFGIPEPPGLVRGQRSEAHLLSSWTLIDAAGWIEPRYDIAGVFQCHYPGVYSRKGPKEEEILVTQPVVIVYDNITAETTPQSTSSSQTHQSSKQNSHRNEESHARTPRSSSESSVTEIRPVESSKPKNRTQEKGASFRSKLLGSVFPGTTRTPGKKGLVNERPPKERSSDSTEKARHKKTRQKPSSSSHHKDRNGHREHKKKEKQTSQAKESG
ncbi:hypothetical protein F4810DRAFT_152613 [Camillea tinctor]|nr:hypothetical protein F4810DRAFT_152613 [Camillea tinctor]